MDMIETVVQLDSKPGSSDNVNCFVRTVKHENIIEMVPDMYYSPHRTPEMIYWKTGLANQ